ncbi:MAG: S1C family serine protease [Eubacteriales bacterium]
MDYKCLLCGGATQRVGADAYRCLYCGKTFSASDFAPSPKSLVTQKAAAINGGADIYEKCIGGVLEIKSIFDDCASAGSGLLISGDGYAITNTHVVTNNALPAKKVTAKIAGETVAARIVALGDKQGGSGSGVDLALLKLERVPRGATVIQLGDFEKVRIGEPVFVIGNSLGCGTCITSGIVSDKLRNVEGHNLMMTDCAVNPGNSGGPIFNTAGTAIGVIVSGIDSAEGMNFAIPASTVEAFLQNCGK